MRFWSFESRRKARVMVRACRKVLELESPQTSAYCIHWQLSLYYTRLKPTQWRQNEPSGPSSPPYQQQHIYQNPTPRSNEPSATKRAKTPTQPQQSPTKPCTGASPPSPPATAPPRPLQPSVTSCTKRRCPRRNRPSATSSTAWCRTSRAC